MARKSKTPLTAELDSFLVSRLSGLPVVTVRDGSIDWHEVVSAAPPEATRILLDGRSWLTLPGPVVMAIDRLHGGQSIFRVDLAAGRIENEAATAHLIGYRETSPGEAERHYLRECSKWHEHPPPLPELDYDDAYDW